MSCFNTIRIANLWAIASYHPPAAGRELVASEIRVAQDGSGFQQRVLWFRSVGKRRTGSLARMQIELGALERGQA
jgi:hypothetical protein